MNAGTHPDEEVGVRELAESWGCSRQHARRKLLALDKAHPGIVRRGPRSQLRVKPEDVAKIGKPVPEPRVVVDARLLRGRVKELEDRLDAVVREKVAQEKREAEFRSTANGWFRRVQILEDKLNR
ncbi:MAG TPA: hypothetical protein VK841_09465 [Polyangiaceae bacterium]|nr:hypothetical protein [Polyangiaceae bacterium]